MFKRLAITVAAVVIASTAFAADDVAAFRRLYDKTKLLSDNEVIDLYWANDAECRDDWSGEINMYCLQRTGLARILERRGLCQSMMPASYKQWRRCIVGSAGFVGGSSPTVIQHDPNSFSYGMSAEESVSPN